MPGDTAVVANPGVGGSSFAVDDDGAKLWPYGKQVWGPGGTRNEVDDATGKRLPVKVSEGLLAGSVVANQITVSTPGEAVLSTVAARRFRLKAHSNNTDIIYLGPAGVTSGTGYPLFPGDLIEVDVTNLNIIHALSPSAAQVLAYLGEV